MTSTADRTVPPDAATRFRAPTYVRNVIDRDRLLAVLREGGGRQSAVIHAPAGYGKTTLAVQWLAILQDDGAATWPGWVCTATTSIRTGSSRTCSEALGAGPPRGRRGRSTI